MPIDVQFIGYTDAKKALADIETGIAEGLPSLFRSLGDLYVENVKHRIITRNDGQWAPASKWARAKTGQAFPTLLGAEKYVKARVTKNSLSIVSTARGWSLTQHHDGFENKLTGPGDKFDSNGRVVLKIKDPRPLNLYTEMRKARNGKQTPRSTTFAFKPRKPGHTPARKIWPTADEAISLGQPIASRWLNQIVTKAGGSIVRV